MIYLKNNTETQTIFIPRETVSGGELINVVKGYDAGVEDGIKIGQQEQKNKLTSLYVTEDGVYEREDGYNLVTVDVKNNSPECPPISLEKGNFTAFENGEYVITPTEGFDGLESLNLRVDVPQEGGDCNLEDKLITPSMGDRDENGYVVVEESEGYDGLSRVMINPSIIYNEGVEDGKSQGGTVTTYPTIKDIYNTEDTSTEVYFKATVAVCCQIGSTCYIIVTDHTGAFYVNTNQSYDVGDECIFTGVVRRDSKTKIRYMSRPVIEVISKGNYVVMPTDAVELTNISDLYAPNDYGNAEMKYLYFEGEVNNFSSTQIRITTPESVSARGEIKLRGSKEEWISNLVIGDYVRIYMFPERSQDYFIPTDFIKLGTEDGESEECNIQIQKRVDLNVEWELFYPDEGYDGVYEVVVDASKKAEEWREEGRNDIRKKLQSIEITENGRYSTDDQIIVKSLRYNGGYHTDTISTYDINRIEVTFKADTSESINGQGEPFILGGSLWGLNESGEDNSCARAIKYAYGRIMGFWEGKWTDATNSMDGEWLTITLDENGMNVKYPNYENYMEYTHNNGNTNGGGDIFPFIIGGQGRRSNIDENGYGSSNLIEDSQFRGLIKYVKINTNSMGEITYIPMNWGYGVWDRKVENTGEYISALEPTEGEITFNDEWQKKYGEGWKEINVNVTPKIINYEGVKFGYSTFTDCPFNIDEIGNYDYMFFDCKKLVNPPIINTPINSAVFMFSGCESLVNGGNYDTSNATNLKGMYGSCHKLQYVGSINCSSLPNDIIGWDREAEIFDTLQYLYLTDFGGFINLKQVVNLKGLISLNEQSVINIFNGLYDFVGNNETPNAIQGKLTMSRFIADIVEAHKSKAENKGWTIIIE